MMQLDELVGNTPLVSLPSPNVTLLAKLEWHNPAGSVKDRVALAMIRNAEVHGGLRPGGTVIEATSGNTGIALAAVCASSGYRCIIVMPENMSRERQLLMKAYSAEVVLSPARQGMSGAVELAQNLNLQIPGSFYADQFRNPENPGAHFASTGPEIWKQTEGKLDIFIAGVGTGGTISGIGKYLKQQSQNIQIIAVEPESSQSIPGIGAGFTPPVLDPSIIDEWIAVTQSQAVAACHQLVQNTGLLAGISSGAALHAAYALAGRKENYGKTLVALLPDSGERYLSTGIWQQKSD